MLGLAAFNGLFLLAAILAKPARALAARERELRAARARLDATVLLLSPRRSARP